MVAGWRFTPSPTVVLFGVQGCGRKSDISADSQTGLTASRQEARRLSGVRLNHASKTAAVGGRDHGGGSDRAPDGSIAIARLAGSVFAPRRGGRYQRDPQVSQWRLLAGALVWHPLVLAGYPLGCTVLRHQPSGPPPDPFLVELAAVAALVAPVEELTWGRLVEPALGIPVTAALFAAKHVVIDGKWRRAVGLAAFWVGLGLVRSRSPNLALGLHLAVNASGVALGHLNRRDAF
jgi:hypothetical protein